MYARSEGKTWIPTMLVTGALFPLSCFSIAAVLNTIAIAYHSLAAVPFGTIVILLLIWMLLSFPLCLLGTVRLPGRAGCVVYIRKNWSCMNLVELRLHHSAVKCQQHGESEKCREAGSGTNQSWVPRLAISIGVLRHGAGSCCSGPSVASVS